MENLKLYAEAAIEIIGILTVLATAITKLTPSPKDDEAVAGFKLKWEKLLAWLPTFGHNKHQTVIDKVEPK